MYLPDWIDDLYSEATWYGQLLAWIWTLIGIPTLISIAFCVFLTWVILYIQYFLLPLIELFKTI